MIKRSKINKVDNNFIIPADELIDEDRWRAPLKVRKGLDVDTGDYSIWTKVDDITVFVKGMPRAEMKELSKELDIELDKQQDYELFKDMVSKLPEDAELKCDQIIEVKTQGRIGAKKQLKKIYDKLGATTGDIFYFEFVNDGVYGRGYFLNLIKKSHIINYIREKKNNRGKK